MADWRLGDLGWYPAGALVATRLGDDHAVIGTALGRAASNGVGELKTDTVEGRPSTRSPQPARACLVLGDER